MTSKPFIYKKIQKKSNFQIKSEPHHRVGTHVKNVEPQKYKYVKEPK